MLTNKVWKLFKMDPFVLQQSCAQLACDPIAKPHMVSQGEEVVGPET